MTIRTDTAENESTDAMPAWRCIEVRWSAFLASSNDPFKVCAARGRSHERIDFVLTLEPVDEMHALLEAWIETGGGRRDVFPRQPVGCRIAEGSGLIHVDADHHGRRVATLSLSGNGDAVSTRSILYARTALLDDAGFAPGAYDPPTARLLTPKQDVASA